MAVGGPSMRGKVTALGTATTVKRPSDRLVLACILVLAVNAVLIQTVLTEDSIIKQLVRVCVLGLVVLSLTARNSFLPMWLVGMCVWSLVLLTGTQNSDQLSIVFVLTLSVWLALVPERAVLLSVAIASVVALLLVFALLAAGITQDEILEFRQRRTFGTAGVPFFFNVVFGAGALGVLYTIKFKSRRSRWIVTVVTLAGATWLFGQTDARGGYVALLLFMGLLWVVPRLRITPLYAATPAVLMAVSLYLSYASGPALNSLLSQRPRLYRTFLDQSSLGDLVLSSSAKQAGFAVDNSYLHLLVGTGVVTAVVFLILFWRAVTSLMNRGMHAEVAFLIATAAYCLTESLLVRIENPFVVFAWFLLVRYGTPLSVEEDNGLERIPAARRGSRARRGGSKVASALSQ